MCAQFTRPMIPPRLSIRLVPSWIGYALGFALLVLGAPSAVFAQNPDIQDLITRGRQAGLDTKHIQTVVQRARETGLRTDVTANLLRAAVDLAEQDLPATPLLNKTLEGFSKQVPPDRLQPVVQQFRTYTEQAGQLVSQWRKRPEVRSFTGMSENSASKNKAQTRLISAIAEAQLQDLQIQNIDRFLNELPSTVERRPVPLSDVATAVSVLPDLPGSKRSPEATRRLLTAALEAGYNAESLRQLPAALRSARLASQRPANALVRGAAQAIARGTPAADVLRGLFQGSPPGVGPPAGVGNGPPGKGPGPGKPPGQGGKPPGAGPPENPPGGGGPPTNPGGGSSY